MKRKQSSSTKEDRPVSTKVQKFGASPTARELERASSPRKAAELKRKKPKAKVDENQDSLLSNAELAAGAVFSILKDSDLRRSKAMLVDEALALSLQGVASVSLQLCLLPCCLHVER